MKKSVSSFLIWLLALTCLAVAQQPASTPTTADCSKGQSLSRARGLATEFSAQTQNGAWSNLNHLKAGQEIEVIESSMKRHAGEFVTVTDELLTLKEKGSDISVKRDGVVRVSTSSGSKRGEHALIGLIVGGGIGAAIGAASGSSTGFLGGSSRGIAALVGTVIGAPSGAAVGAVLPAHAIVYRASAPAGSRLATSD